MTTIAAYRDRATGAYPVSMLEIRQWHPDKALPAEFEEEVYNLVEADPVYSTERPDDTEKQVYEGAPELAGGRWHQTWIVEDLPAGEPVITGVTILYPADLWRRTRDEDNEAEQIEIAMLNQSARLRNLFSTAQSYRSDDPLWPILQTAAVQLFGEERAAELLAPSS